MVYQKKPKSEWKKPGPKPGPIGAKIRERISHFNGMPQPIYSQPSKDDITRDFYAKAKEILNKQLGKLYKKSLGSNLDINQIRTLLEMVKTNMILDKKETDLTPDNIDSATLESALKVMNAINEQKEEKNEPRENTTIPKKD